MQVCDAAAEGGVPAFRPDRMAPEVTYSMLSVWYTSTHKSVPLSSVGITSGQVCIGLHPYALF